jgi:hypothetical protein
MSTTEKVSLFVQETIARIKGDDNEVIALYNERRCKSTLDAQIGVEEAEIVRLEDSVTTAEEALKDAIYPKYKLEDTSSYIANIRAARKKVEKAKSDLKERQDIVSELREIRSSRF